MTNQQKQLILGMAILVIIALLIANQVNAETPEDCILRSPFTNSVGGVILNGKFEMNLSMMETDYPELNDTDQVRILSNKRNQYVVGYALADSEARPMLLYQDVESGKVYLAIFDDPRLPEVFDSAIGTWKFSCFLEVTDL